MSAVTKKLGRADARKAAEAALRAKTAHIKHSSPVQPPNPDLGREIFVYHHLQTNQTVYSLTKGLNNNHALRQLPYNGKKTVPAALRKDLWYPLAQISFSPLPTSSDTTSPAPYGLKTLHKLREYRKLHETQWPLEFAKDSSGEPLSKKLRGRKLCDQKANSVADMAAALKNVTLGKVKVEKGPGGVEEEGMGKETRPLVRATVRWRDILDAEFAESWPESVVHDTWVVGRNNRRVPGSVVGVEEVEAPVAATV